jgi:hypothetical protein
MQDEIDAIKDVESTESQPVENEDLQTTGEAEATETENQNETAQEDEGEQESQEADEETEPQEEEVNVQENKVESETEEALRLYKKFKEDKEEFVKTEILKDKDVLSIVEREISLNSVQINADSKINASLSEIKDAEKAIAEITQGEEWNTSEIVSAITDRFATASSLKEKLEILDDQSYEYYKVQQEIEKCDRDIATLQKLSALQTKIQVSRKQYEEAFRDKQIALDNIQKSRNEEALKKDPVFQEIGLNIDGVAKILSEKALNVARGDREKANSFYNLYVEEFDVIMQNQDFAKKTSDVKKYLSNISEAYAEDLLKRQKNKLSTMRESNSQNNTNKSINASPKAGGVEGKIDKVSDFVAGKVSPNFFRPIGREF